MKIYPVTHLLKPQVQDKKSQNIHTPQSYQTANTLYPLFNDHLIAFGARVDKGLERFYDANMERMPQTVKEYIEGLEDKSQITPLEAQNKAFELLEISQSIKDIKDAYPNEPLFSDLINPNQSRATRGILNSVKENEELLELSNQGVLKDKSNLTVYLVKKVFLEDKTIDEINKDLDKDLDDDFKADFKFKNPDSKYVYTTTLNSLGIKTPSSEYRQSLRYTRDGYADIVGEKISEGQRAFWDSLDPAERTVRAKKSVEKFEIWWNSMTKNQILDMIADEMTELDMLRDFKKQQKINDKMQRETNTKTEPSEKIEEPRKHIKVGSSKLSQDELFIKLASIRLKLYLENLSEAEKDTLHIKRMQRLATRWKEMSPAERTDYISKMQSGAEPLRYTMIDAWNHSTDLIKDLSTHLRENQIYKPADLLYTDKSFSEFQSKVMTEFWENHPEHASSLGNRINISQQKIKTAISRGTFEELKKEIMRDKNQRIKEMEKFKQNNIQQSKPIEQTNKTPEYFQAFKTAYYKVLGAQLKNLPAKYITDYFKVIENGYPKEAVEAWTRNLNGEAPLEADMELLKHISSTEPEGGSKINRALEAAIADTLYDCTKNPEVYLFSHSDMKVALTQIARGESIIKIGSLVHNKTFEMPLVKNRIDASRISLLYSKYYEPLNENEVDGIIASYFDYDGTDTTEDELKDYIQTYGKSANIIFSDKSAFSKDVKSVMYQKFLNNMPSRLKAHTHCLLSNSTEPFEKEEEIKRTKFAFGKKFDFIPQVYMENYTNELAKMFRNSNNKITTEDFINLCCAKRKDAKARGKLAILPKDEFNTMNKIRTLAMEQAMADLLFDATNNVDVYGLSFEELCDNIEIFNLVKKWPSEERNFNSFLSGKTITLSANKKLNTSQLKNQYLSYVNEIIDWLNTEVKEKGSGEFEDLLYILNPDEDMPEKDDIVSQRIKLYNLNLE